MAARFGVSESTALDAKPYHLRAIRPRPTQWRKMERNAAALRLYEADATLAEIAEATGRSISTTRRYLRSAIPTPTPQSLPSPPHLTAPR